MIFLLAWIVFCALLGALLLTPLARFVLSGMLAAGMVLGAPLALLLFIVDEALDRLGFASAP